MSEEADPSGISDCFLRFLLESFGNRIGLQWFSVQQCSIPSFYQFCQNISSPLRQTMTTCSEAIVHSAPSVLGLRWLGVLTDRLRVGSRFKLDPAHTK